MLVCIGCQGPADHLATLVAGCQACHDLIPNHKWPLLSCLHCTESEAVVGLLRLQAGALVCDPVTPRCSLDSKEQPLSTSDVLSLRGDSSTELVRAPAKPVSSPPLHIHAISDARIEPRSTRGGAQSGRPAGWCGAALAPAPDTPWRPSSLPVFDDQAAGCRGLGPARRQREPAEQPLWPAGSGELAP